MMQINLGRQVIDYLVDAKTSVHRTKKQFLSIGFYGGEPLLNMPFVDSMVDYTNRFRGEIEFSFHMTTNALLLDKYMDFLAAYDFALLISLDGNKEANGHRITHEGTSSYEKVYSNAKLLKYRHPDYFAKSVMFNSVLHNLNDVESLRNFIYSEFGKYPDISSVNPRGLDPEKIHIFKGLYRDYYTDIRSSKHQDFLSESLFLSDPDIKDLRRYLMVNENHYSDYNQLFETKRNGYKSPCPGTCTPFSRKMFVTVNGKVLPCERIGQEYCFGKVTEQGVNLEPEAVAILYNSLIGRLASQCEACAAWQICSKCIYYALSETPSDSPHCNDMMNKDEYKAWKEEKYRYLALHPQLYKKLTERMLMV